MEEIRTGDRASRYFCYRLSRQNRYLDFLEMELERAGTEAEAAVVLSMLESTKKRVDRLEDQFLHSCGMESG